MQLDLLSFFVGFIVATLFWFVVLRLRHLLPKLREINKKRKEEQKKLHNQGIVFLIRKTTLRRCQSSHLFSAFFPISSILIEPHLYAKPLPADPDGTASPEPLIDHLLPYLPDCSSIMADMPIHKISLANAMSRGKNIVITGEPGSGKTIALAKLASDIAENKSEQFKEFLPIFLHCRELDFTSTNDNPINNFLPALQRSLKSISKELLSEVISSSIEEKKLILFLDGYEEVSASVVSQIDNWLSSLLKKYPGIRIATTSSSTFTGKLINLGFSALPIAYWSKAERQKHVHLWQTEWSRLAPEDIDNQAISLISNNVQELTTPLKQTLRLWSILTNNVDLHSSESIIAKICTQMVPLSAETYTKIAEKVASSEYRSISSSDLGLILSSDPIFKISDDNTPENQPIAQTAPEKALPRQTPDTIISDLIRYGILNKVDSSAFNFCHPSQFISFASLSKSIGVPQSWRSILRSNVDEQISYHQFASGKLSDYVNRWLDEEDAPLYRNLQLLSRWSIESNFIDSAFSNKLFTRIFKLVQDHQLPLNLRLRLIIPFLYSSESTSLQLFKMLSGNSDESLRLISAFSLGFLHSPQAVELLYNLSRDKSKLVQKFACISLSKLWTPSAQKVLVDLILNADEETRQLIAELFAFNQPEGHDLLKEISVLEENIVARRASVYGLQLILENWAIDLLKNMSINDSQWVVRNAAAQALESPTSTLLYIPFIPSQPSESPWLIKYASGLGIGLPAGDYPYDLFIKILMDEKNEYQRQALDYITTRPEIKTLKKLSSMMGADYPEIRNEIFESFMQFSQRGLLT